MSEATVLPMPTMTDLRTVPLIELTTRCQAQTLAYLRTKELGDDRYCLELFRRAVQDDDQGAWAFIYTFYSTEEFLGEHYVLKWVRSWLNGRYGSTIRVYYTEEEMVQEIWMRFMRSEAAKAFAFSDMRHLMAYLRRLVNNYALDIARRKTPEIVNHSGENAANAFDQLLSSISDHQEGVETHMVNQEAIFSLLRKIVGEIVVTEQEMLVFRGYFLEELPPRRLYELYPTVFSKGEVETIRTRLARRLRRAPFLLTRYIHQVVLNDDERRRVVFDKALIVGWPDERLLETYPDLFENREEIWSLKVQVLAELNSRPLLLKVLSAAT